MNFYFERQLQLTSEMDPRWYLSRNHLFPSTVGPDFLGMRLPSAEEVNADAK